MAKPKKIKETPFEDLSREEQIQKALSRRIALHDTDDSVPDVPESYHLEIGDEVEIGNLKDCVVVGMSDNKKRIAIEYRDSGERYGTPFDNGRKIHQHSWLWYSVIPKKATKPTEFKDDSAGGQYLQMGGRRNSDLECLLHGVIRRGFWINEKYQRGYVWTDDDKTHLLDSIFKGISIGEFVFIENTHKHDWTYEVLDGQQRLTTLVDFVMSRFKYRGFYWHELSVKDRSTFDNLSVAWVELDGKYLDDIAKAKIFLLTNVAGVPQSEEHLAKVRSMLYDSTPVDDAPYGYCPTCFEKGISRERRMNGNDTCAKGHVYPSKDAVPF